MELKLPKIKKPSTASNKSCSDRREINTATAKRLIDTCVRTNVALMWTLNLFAFLFSTFMEWLANFSILIESYTNNLFIWLATFCEI